MRQDTGRRVTILDRNSYTEECLDVLNTKQFHKPQKDPSKNLEREMQRTLRKMEIHFDEKEYEKL